jgi:hypothetical protein
MKNLRELNDVDENTLDQHIRDKVIISSKFFGTKLSARIKHGTIFVFKKRGIPVTKLDLLTSDSYSESINILNTEEGLKSIDCHLWFTYNHDKKILILEKSSDEINYQWVNPSIKEEELLFNGYIDATTKKALLTKNRKKITKIFNPSELSHAIVFDCGGFKFKVDVASHIKTNNKPSEIYNLLLIDAIRSVDEESLNKIFISDIDRDSILISIIDKIFLNWLKVSKFNLNQIDIELENHMTVDVDDKIKMLNLPIKSLVEDKKLYYPYMMLLLSFRKPISKSNTFLTDNIRKKYDRIFDTIDFIYKNQMNIVIPSFSESINN